jgi:hypothetical protein
MLSRAVICEAEELDGAVGRWAYTTMSGSPRCAAAGKANRVAVEAHAG